jgi:osmotically-inducible protein OsmY
MEPYQGAGNRVRIALINEKRIGHAILRVNNNQGVITLNGVVENSASSLLAEDITRKQTGVVKVINQLTIGK